MFGLRTSILLVITGVVMKYVLAATEISFSLADFGVVLLVVGVLGIVIPALPHLGAAVARVFKE